MSRPWQNPAFAAPEKAAGPITIQSVHEAFADGLAGKCDHVDPMFAALSLLSELAEAERLIPGLLAEIRTRADEIVVLSEISEDRELAKLHLASDGFDTAEGAYFHLYFRTARKGYGVDRAIRIAEFAIEDLARTKSDTESALRGAIAAMREEEASEDVQRAGCWQAAAFKHDLHQLLTSAAPASIVA